MDRVFENNSIKYPIENPFNGKRFRSLQSYNSISVFEYGQTSFVSVATFSFNFRMFSNSFSNFSNDLYFFFFFYTDILSFFAFL